MCENFGVLYGSDAGPGGDLHYEIGFDKKRKRIIGLVCRYCGAEIKLHAARSIRPIARHFLAESLPFTHCEEEDCENHGRNAFECWQYRPRPYHVNGDLLRCNGRRKSDGRRCRESVDLGTPPIKGKDDPDRQCVFAKILLLIRLGLSMTHANGVDVTSDDFQRYVRRFGSLYRDYHAYRNSFLLKPGWCGQEDKTAVVLTDVLQVSLKRFGIGPERTQRLNVIVSVLRLENTWFVLAAHPYYLPKDKAPGLLEIQRDIQPLSRALHRRWAGLHTILDKGRLVRTEPGRKLKEKAETAEDGTRGDGDAEDKGEEGKAKKKEPRRRGFVPGRADAGHYGYMVRSPFAEVAHFLVVQRMLSRFKRVFFYTDAAKDLTSSVLVATRDGVRSGRVQVAVMQHQKIGRRERDRVRERGLPREEALPTVFDRMEDRFKALVEERLKERPAPLLASEERRIRATVWRNASDGAHSTAGAFAWLKGYPRDTRQYKNCHTLWLTRGPDEKLEDGQELLLGVTLQSVDSACRTLRKRINTFKRPDKAAKGVTYSSSSYRVENAVGELRTHLLMRNYARRSGKKWSETRISAVVLGATGGDTDAVDMQALLWDFRLNVRHAQEVSEWMAL